MTHNLCTCNNCSKVYFDSNPSDESIEYPDEILTDCGGLIGELIQIEDEEDGDIFTGCPECKTDGCLMDNVNGNAGGNAEIIAKILKDKFGIIEN